MKSPWMLVVSVLGVGVALRLLTLFGYPLQLYPDSSTYVQAAHDLFSSGPWQGQARRTPGYPLVIALVGADAWRLHAANAVAGLATGLLLLGLALRLTGSRLVAACAGLFHLANLQQWFQEGALLTETFATLGVVAVLALFVWLMARWRAGHPSPWAAAALGLLSAYALFARPQFIVFLLLLPLAAWLAWPAPRLRARALLAPLAIATPIVALVLAWCAVVQQKTGYFTLSTQSGFGMVNHPIDYIELAPERYAVVRDVLIRVRERRMAEAGHTRNTIWYAWPEIQAATGWSMPEASVHFQRMCSQMAREHPLRFAASAFRAWVDFWTVPIFWKPEALQPAALAGPLQALWWVEHKLLRAANGLWLLMLAAALLPAWRRRMGWDLTLTVMALTVLGSSVIQALADQGASSRYHLPTQSLVVLMLLVAGHRVWRSRRATVLPAAAA